MFPDGQNMLSVQGGNYVLPLTTRHPAKKGLRFSIVPETLSCEAMVQFK